ncbi:MAG: hypothetical protein ACRD01_15005, partial [Terriglobales bacterium]
AGGAAAGGGRGGRGGGGATPPPPEGGGTPGALVLPGTYHVALYQHWEGKWTELGQPQALSVQADTSSTPPAAALAAHADFMRQLEQLQAQVSAVQAYSTAVGADLTTLRATAAAYPASHQSLIDQTDALEHRYDALAASLRGGGFGGGGGGATPSLGARLSNAAGAERQSLSAPTGTSVEDVRLVRQALAPLETQLRSVGGQALPALEKAFAAAGAPVPATLPVLQETAGNGR